LADSPAFDWTCDRLESESDLDRLEARGTIRISLKRAGLEASGVEPDQMRVVIEKILPAELEARGVGQIQALCARLAAGVATLSTSVAGDSPDVVFERLGGC